MVPAQGTRGAADLEGYRAFAEGFLDGSDWCILLGQRNPGTCMCSPRPHQGRLKDTGVLLAQHKCPSLPEAERGGMHVPRASDTPLYAELSAQVSSAMPQNHPARWKRFPSLLSRKPALPEVTGHSMGTPPAGDGGQPGPGSRLGQGRGSPPPTLQHRLHRPMSHPRSAWQTPPPLLRRQTGHPRC